MRIHFIGLSSFLIENNKGYRIVVDPFNDSPEWSLGPRFPSAFRGKPFGTNIVLMSEPDADHSRAPNEWLQNAPPTKPHSDPFPGLSLRGTVIYEYNGDVNIAWHYTVDGVRCAHFADNAHIPTPEQCKELGTPDIIFWCFPKEDSLIPGVLEKTKKSIELLRPKLVICAHHIVPADLPRSEDPSVLRTYYKAFFKRHAARNKYYRGEESFIQLSYVLENAYLLTKEFPSTILDAPTMEITPELLARGKDRPTIVLFRTMLASTSL